MSRYIIKEHQAKQVIYLLYNTRLDLKSIGKQTGINSTSVLRILKGDTFKHLERPSQLPLWRY